MSGTLITGPEPLEVVGESFHQGELAAIAKARRGESDVIAILVAEEGRSTIPTPLACGSMGAPWSLHNLLRQ